MRVDKRPAQSGPFFPAGRRPLFFFLSLAGAAGLYFGLPNARLHLPPLFLLYPFCLYLLARLAASDGQAFRAGWLAGFTANAAGLYWLVYPMSDVAGMPMPLAVCAALLLFAYLACYAGLSALGMRRLHLLCAKSAGLPATARAILPPLAGALAFGGFQVLCGTLFSGFPWLSPAIAFSFSPAWIQAAALIGGYALGALYAAPACLAAAAALAEKPSARLACLALAALLLAAPPVYGLLRLNAPRPGSGPPLSLVIAQGNVDQNQKWEPAFQEATFIRYREISRAALAEARSARPDNPPTLLVWPETAMPVYFPRHREYAEALRAFAREEGVYLLFGAMGVEDIPEGGARLYNRLALIDPEGRVLGWYDKRHLVPFGEYMPFAVSIPYLRELLQGLDFSSGAEKPPLRLGSGGQGPGLSLGSLICYEAIFPSPALEQTLKGAEALVNVSNDGWFRKSSAPYQHLAHAALRAVEQSRPLIRATNTGISAVLDERGRITARLEGLFVSGSLAAELRPNSDLTLYRRIYPAPEILLVLAALFALCGHGIIHRKRHAPTART